MPISKKRQMPTVRINGGIVVEIRMSRSYFVVALFVSFLFYLFGCSSPSRQDLGGNLGLDNLLATSLDAGKDVLAVLVKLELGDDHVGGVDAEGNRLAGSLVAGDALDVNNVLEAVDRGNLALLALLGAADNGDLVVLADGDGADLGVRTSVNVFRHAFKTGTTHVVLLTELLGEGGAHDVAANAGGGLEVGLARLASRGCEVCRVESSVFIPN